MRQIEHGSSSDPSLPKEESGHSREISEVQASFLLFHLERERESIYERRAKGFATSSRPSKLDLWPGRSDVGPPVRPAPVITVSQ